MVLGFIIWSMIDLIFVVIGISTWKSKEAVGFFTFSEAPEIKEIAKYNHAVGKLWFFFAVVLEILGIPILFIEQNSPVFMFMIFGVMILVIAIIIMYLKIEGKYKQKV